MAESVFIRKLIYELWYNTHTAQHSDFGRGLEASRWEWRGGGSGSLLSCLTTAVFVWCFDVGCVVADGTFVVFVLLGCEWVSGPFLRHSEILCSFANQGFKSGDPSALL